MTLNEFLDASHLWAEQNTQLILLFGVDRERRTRLS